MRILFLVLWKLTGFDPDLEDPRKEGKHNTQTGGASAHKRQEYEIGRYKPFGNCLTLESEVFILDEERDFKVAERRREKHSLGIDIRVLYKGNVVVVMDLKTSKRHRGFSRTKAIEIGKRNGNVPVIEFFIPFL